MTLRSSAVVILSVTAILKAAEVRDAPDTPAPFPLSEAVSRMNYPEGFQVKLFAGEPQVVQPISMTLDARGRLWVVESMAYPQWQRTDGPGKDRVVILEDTDGDGTADSRKVFLDNGRNLTSVAVGMGGVWLCSTPNFLFVPDRDHDDKPDGAPEIRLDGWDLNAQHNAFNGLAWGPDGWLYGCNGILSNSKVGKPGTPEAQRTFLNCGVWRYHPTRQEFEVVAHGTTNPWGIAFDEHGEMFVANCVIKHLFHIVPGARYERMFGQDTNPYAFELIPSCANHIHWAGGFWKTEGANNVQNETVGGGHAHCGAMVYLGDNWPDKYRGGFYTLNVHGHRINHDTLERRGSGIVAHHAPDVLKANDPWFRGVSLLYGPDGAVYMSDWSDSGECHDYVDIHPENGRVYRITYGEAKRFQRNLNEASDADLIALQTHKNDWLASTARLVLQERSANGKLQPGTLKDLRKLAGENGDDLHQLRYLWALNAAGGGKDLPAPQGLKDEFVRGWSVQLAAEADRGSLTKLSSLARSEKSPLARRFMASALQRIAPQDRVSLASALASHAEDASDPVIPYLLWYGIEPLASTNTSAALKILSATEIPLVRQFIAQRLALRNELESLADALGRSTPKAAIDVVRGIFMALNGQRNLKGPRNWPETARKFERHENPDTRSQVAKLSLIFGNEGSDQKLRELALNPAENIDVRRDALQALVQARVADLPVTLRQLLKDQAVRLTAIQGLSAFDDDQAAEAIIASYEKFNSEEQNEAIATLSSRPAYAIALLNAVKNKAVPMRQVTPFAARQMQAHKDAKIDQLVTEIFGTSRAIAADKAARIGEFRKLLTKERLAMADLSQGRVAFNRTCGACHTLFGEGGKLAPEITGSQRSNLDFILENVVDPNAVVWGQYKATYFETADDRLISGVVLKENEGLVTIQTQTGTVTVPQKEITARTQSNLSIMPEGLFDTLEEQELLDLVAYLQSPTQVPLPAEAK